MVAVTHLPSAGGLLIFPQFPAERNNLTILLFHQTTKTQLRSRPCFEINLSPRKTKSPRYHSIVNESRRIEQGQNMARGA